MYDIFYVTEIENISILQPYLIYCEVVLSDIMTTGEFWGKYNTVDYTLIWRILVVLFITSKLMLLSYSIQLVFMPLHSEPVNVVIHQAEVTRCVFA